MLHFNTPEGSKERQETKPLTLGEETKVVEILNDRINGLPEDLKGLLQRFLNHYQNLNHHKATTVGLWATDEPGKVSDPEKLMFQIKF